MNARLEMPVGGIDTTTAGEELRRNCAAVRLVDGAVFGEDAVGEPDLAGGWVGEDQIDAGETAVGRGFQLETEGDYRRGHLVQPPASSPRAHGSSAFKTSSRIGKNTRKNSFRIPLRLAGLFEGCQQDKGAKGPLLCGFRRGPNMERPQRNQAGDVHGLPVASPGIRGLRINTSLFMRENSQAADRRRGGAVWQIQPDPATGP